MKGFTCLVAVLVLICFVACENVNKCYDLETNHYWDSGTTYNPPGQCVSLTCRDEGRSMTAKDCPEFVVPPRCKKLDYNFAKPFPDCCPRLVCQTII